LVRPCSTVYSLHDTELLQLSYRTPIQYNATSVYHSISHTQILDIPTNSERPYSLQYDPEWLAILCSTEPLMKYSHALWLPPHPMTDERWVVLLKYASAMSVAPLNEMFTVVWKLVIIIVC